MPWSRLARTLRRRYPSRTTLRRSLPQTSGTLTVAVAVASGLDFLALPTFTPFLANLLHRIPCLCVCHQGTMLTRLAVDLSVRGIPHLSQGAAYCTPPHLLHTPPSAAAPNCSQRHREQQELAEGHSLGITFDTDAPGDGFDFGLVRRQAVLTGSIAPCIVSLFGTCHGAVTRASYWDQPNYSADTTPNSPPPRPWTFTCPTCSASAILFDVTPHPANTYMQTTPSLTCKCI